MIGVNYADINRFAIYLHKNKICPDITPILNGMRSIQNGGKKGEVKSLVIEKLKLNLMKLDADGINLPKNTKPDLVRWYIILDVSIPLVDTNMPDCDFSGYSFRFQIVGEDEKGNSYYDAWHLDYDKSYCPKEARLDEIKGKKEKNEPEYIHPWFHLTHGGDAIKDKDHGELLSIIVPRIAYPPMDLVLGIDFLLSNFVKKTKYLQIQSDGQYKSSVSAAQEWLLKPYILSIAHNWCNYNCGNYANLSALGKCYVPNLQNSRN